MSDELAPEAASAAPESTQEQVEAQVVHDASQSSASPLEEAKAEIEGIVEQAQKSVEEVVDVAQTAAHNAVEAAYDAVLKAEAGVLEKVRGTHSLSASALHSESTYVHIRNEDGSHRTEQILGGS